MYCMSEIVLPDITVFASDIDLSHMFVQVIKACERFVRGFGHHYSLFFKNTVSISNVQF